MYEGIKCALGPTQTKTAPLKSACGEVITDKGKQMERWVEHYSELYSRENVAVSSVLDSIVPLPVMEELDTDPTLEELYKAIDSLIFGKAPGNNGIPPDLIKRCKKTPFCSPFLTSSANDRERESYHKTCEMPTLSPCKEQGWQKWLQQLQRHLPPEHRRQTLRPHHADEPA